MTKAQLKKGRLYVPGVAAVIGSLPILYAFHASRFGLGDLRSIVAIVLLIALVLGYIYRLFDIRKRYFAPGLNRVHENIKAKLLEPFANDPVIAAKATYSWGAFQAVFYHFIDSDPSLANKAEDVYENGLIWTSLIDIKTIATAYAFIYLVLFEFVQPTLVLLAAAGIGAMLIAIADASIESVIAKHLRLGNDQLSYIVLHHRQRLEQLLTALQDV